MMTDLYLTSSYTYLPGIDNNNHGLILTVEREENSLRSSSQSNETLSKTRKSERKQNGKKCYETNYDRLSNITQKKLPVPGSSHINYRLSTYCLWSWYMRRMRIDTIANENVIDIVTSRFDRQRDTQGRQLSSHQIYI